jgi:hypothetical protein
VGRRPAQWERFGRELLEAHGYAADDK